MLCRGGRTVLYFHNVFASSSHRNRNESLEIMNLAALPIAVLPINTHRGSSGDAERLPSRISKRCILQLQHARRGLGATLLDALRYGLNRCTQHDVFTFRYKEGLKPGGTWSKKLLHASANSAVLVSTLLPGSLSAITARRRLESFLGGSAVFSDAAQRSHIFQVELLCPAPEGHWLTAAPGRNIVKSAP